MLAKSLIVTEKACPKIDATAPIDQSHQETPMENHLDLERTQPAIPFRNQCYTVLINKVKIPHGKTQGQNIKHYAHTNLFALINELQIQSSCQNIQLQLIELPFFDRSYQETVGRKMQKQTMMLRLHHRYLYRCPGVVYVSASSPKCTGDTS